jgi:hypothetical protein
MPHLTPRRLPLCATLMAIAFAGCARPPAAMAADAPPPAQAPAVAADAVPVRKVVLFSSGVGYFEHAGSVDGTVASELRFKTAQINDVLKSLVVEDSGGGRVSTIAYPSQDPIAKTLKSFQVDISGNPALGDLLTQLRGAKVQIALASEQLSGTILGVEKRVRVVGDRGDKVEEWVLSLMTGASVRAIPLDDVRSLDLLDPLLKAELEKALSALAQARDQDKKPVVITFQGDGRRPVRIGYVVEAPVWKTSYRLLLSDDPATKPALQGWAIVENQTDNDWTDVTLNLVSGRPVSFVQDLYQPLYVPRPVVEPELFASLRPQTYGDALAQRGPVQEFARAKEGRAARKQAMAPGAPAASVAPMEMTMDANEAGEMAGAGGPMDITRGVNSIAGAEKLGAFFQYSVPKVSLARQRSAMIPVITEDIGCERVSIYNLGVLAKHPLLGAKLTNSTGKHLQQGPITVLDHGSYAGDARIDDVPPGGERLLSFAIDLEVTAQAEGRQQRSTVLTGKLVGGVLEVKRRLVQTQEYVVANKGTEDRALIIEHPIAHGWTLVDTAKPVETTDALYRFREPLAVGETRKLTVNEERVESEAIALLPADYGTIEFYARTGEIPAGVREALAKAATLKRAYEATGQQIQQKQQRIDEITQEQERIRQNMRTVDQKSPYYQRLMTKLNDQETALDGLRGEIDRLRQQQEAQRTELEQYLANLTLEK